VRQPIHPSHALEPVATARTMAVGRATRDHRPQATLLRAGRWVAVLVAVAGMDLWLTGEFAAAADTSFTASGTANWGTAGNWSAGVPTAADRALFPTVATSVITIPAAQSVSGIVFNNSSNATFKGEGGNQFLEVGAQGIVVDAGTLTLGVSTDGERLGIRLTDSHSWTNNRANTDGTTLVRSSGSGAGIDLQSYTLTFAGTGGSSLDGPLTGSGGIVKSGSGSINFTSNSPTFTGGVVMNGGFLQLSASSSGTTSGPLGNPTSSVLTINGGTLTARGTAGSTRTVANPMVWNEDFTVGPPPTVDLVNLALTGSATLSGANTVRTVTVGNSDGLPTFSVGQIGDGGNNVGITKNGNGTLVFLGNNTYTGLTTVSAGSLQLGNGGSVAGNIALDGSSTRLVIDRSTGLVYGGVISGDGSIVKNGIGGLTLTGANTYTGTLTVNAGALGIDSVASLPGWNTAGRYAIGASAAITFGANVTEEQIATILSAELGNVNAAAGTGFDTTGGNTTFSGNLATAFGTRNIAKTGPNSLLLDGESTNTTTFSIAGGLVQAASAENAGTSGPLGRGGIVFAGGTLQYSAANQTDYSPRFTAATQVYAADTNGQNVTWGRAFTLGDNGGISKAGAGTLTLSGGSVTMGTSGLAASGGTLAVSAITLTSTTGALLDVTGGGRIEIGGVNRIGTSAMPLSITGGGEVVFTGRYLNVGQATVTVTGGATVSFDRGDNAINGQILVNDGVIVGGTLANMNTNSSFGGQTNDARATVRLGNANTSGTLRYTGSGGSAGSTNRLIQIGSGSGTGGAVLEQNGTGAVTFSGTGGFLNTQDTAATSPRSLTLSGTNTNANTISAVIRDNSPSGGVSVVKSGSGTWLLSGTNTYTGTTTISQGALAVASTASLPGWNTAARYSVASGAGLAVGNSFTEENVATVLGTNNLAAGAAIGFDTSAANRTFAGDLAVTFANRPVIKTGTNSLILTGTNTPQNGTTVYAGTLQVGDGGTTGSLAGDINVLSTGQLAFSRSDNITATNVISGAGTIVQSGTGRLTLSTANPSFSGLLQAPAGTVRVTNGGALGTGTISPGGGANSGTVELDGGISLPNGLAIGARDSTTSTNTVAVRNVLGTNTISGNVTISPGGNVYQLVSDAGLLRLTGTWGAAGSAANTGRTIALSGAGDFDIAGSIPVQGTTSFNFTKSGEGTMFFSGTRAMAGNTTVSAGRMFMNSGSLFSNRAGTVTIDSGATLAGSGTLENVVAINGIHSPGSSPGLQTFTNNLNYNATGSLVWELSGNTELTADRGTIYDGVNVTGSGGQLAINAAATLALVFDAPLANADPSTVNFNNTFWDSDRTWQMISLAGGATGGSSVFGTISVGADASGNVLATVRPNASFSVASQPDGVYLLYSAVPEPTTTALLVVGAASLLGVIARNRRRRA
jgi:fibronectin-binding autotransporter adhesin